MSERSSSILSTVVGMALPTLGSSDCREGGGGGDNVIKYRGTSYDTQ